MDQAVIAVTGCVAIWLANDRREAWRRWASVVGLAGQPFWFYVAFTGHWWGIQVLTVVYAVSWARGFFNHWMRPPTAARTEGAPSWGATQESLSGEPNSGETASTEDQSAGRKERPWKRRLST